MLDAVDGTEDIIEHVTEASDKCNICSLRLCLYAIIEQDSQFSHPFVYFAGHVALFESVRTNCRTKVFASIALMLSFESLD